jgi:hypothetical protein
MKAKEKEPAQVGIDSLNLTIGGRTLQLSMDEARRLHFALAGVFSPGYTFCGCHYKAPTSWYTYSSTTGDCDSREAIQSIFKTASNTAN